MTDLTNPSILETYDTEVSAMIAANRKISQMDALRIFLNSETHRMLTDNSLRLWYFAPAVLYDLWEAEEATGDPGNSLYLRGDEIG